MHETGPFQKESSLSLEAVQLSARPPIVERGTLLWVRSGVSYR